jgi:hypothetical protein
MSKEAKSALGFINFLREKETVIRTKIAEYSPPYS